MLTGDPLDPGDSKKLLKIPHPVDNVKRLERGIKPRINVCRPEAGKVGK